jgi:hypothetical protein
MFLFVKILVADLDPLSITMNLTESDVLVPFYSSFVSAEVCCIFLKMPEFLHRLNRKVADSEQEIFGSVIKKHRVVLAARFTV